MSITTSASPDNRSRRSAVLWCMAAMVLMMLVSACNKPPSIDRLMADARHYQALGDANAAIIQLKNVLRQNARHGEARYMLGTIYLQKGEALKAETQFREALKEKYETKLILPGLAQALFQQGKFQALLDATRSSDFGAAAVQPGILSLRGHAYLSLDNPQDAARSFEEALKIEADFASALLGKVRLALLRRDTSAALALADRAVAANPKSLDGWLMKGDIERLAGRPEAAGTSYQQAVLVEPLSVVANFNMASLLLAQGKDAESRVYVTAIRKAAPHNPVGFFLSGLIEFRDRNFEDANQAALEALTKAPNYLPAKALVSAITFHTGSNEQAEHQLRDVLAQYPKSVYFQKLLAASLLKGHKVQGALEVLEPLIKSHGDEPGLFALIAEAYYQKGDFDRAKRYFEMAAKRSPENPKVRVGLGLSRLASGETDRALADLEIAMQFNNSDSDMFLVKSLLSARQFDKAWTIVERLKKIKPDDPEVMNAMGTIHLARKNFIEARKAFERALTKQPGYFPASMNLAALDMGEKKYEAARIRYGQILDKNPSNIEVMLALARLADASGKQSEAITWLERAKSIQPQAFSPNYTLASIAFNQGDYAKAVSMLRDALAAQPDHVEVLNMLGYSLIQIGKPSEALTTYTKLTSLRPKSAEALYGLSSAELARGNTLGAMISLQRVLDLKPDFPEAIYALSSLYIDGNKIADALKIASMAQARYPKSALGFLIEGNARMAEQDFNRAVRAYEKALRLEKSGNLVLKLHKAMYRSNRAAAANTQLTNWLKDNPEDVAARLYYADVAIKENRYSLAIEQYEAVLQMQPRDLGVLHNLGWCYRQQNNLAMALQVAEQAYKINPDSPAVLVDISDLLLEKGEVDRAIRLLEKARVLLPASQDIRYRLVKGYLANGDKVAARTELKQLLNGGGEFSERAEATALLDELNR